MLINGRARMACSALIDNLEQPVRLEPFSKFPIVRDFGYRPQRDLREILKAVKAWVPIDGTYDPWRRSAHDRGKKQEQAYPISRLHLVLLLQWGCPQFNEETGFVGRATHRAGRTIQHASHRQSLQRGAVLAALNGRWRHPGSAATRRTASRCCPKDIPLTKAISEVGGAVMKQAIGDLFRR